MVSVVSVVSLKPTTLVFLEPPAATIRNHIVHLVFSQVPSMDGFQPSMDSIFLNVSPPNGFRGLQDDAERRRVGTAG